MVSRDSQVDDMRVVPLSNGLNGPEIGVANNRLLTGMNLQVININ